VATGKVLQFDHNRGYGFIAADDGGEDVFLHASVFDGDCSGLSPGVVVEFQVIAGDRGRKACGARLREKELAASRLTDLAQLSPAMPTTEDEQTCEVLSETEFKMEVTELLLKTVPELTSGQILEVRRQMLDFAGQQGWVDANERLLQCGTSGSR
jgi:CspA family cold shock protein